MSRAAAWTPVRSDTDAEIDELEAKLAKACQIRQGMMQELLTGRTRLIEPVNSQPNSEENAMQVQRQFVEVKQRQVVIELPESFINHRIEVIALTVDEDEVGPPNRQRRPHPDIAGKSRTLGDLISPLIDETEWGCLK